MPVACLSSPVAVPGVAYHPCDAAGTDRSHVMSAPSGASAMERESIASSGLDAPASSASDETPFTGPVSQYETVKHPEDLSAPYCSLDLAPLAPGCLSDLPVARRGLCKAPLTCSWTRRVALLLLLTRHLTCLLH